MTLEEMKQRFAKVLYVNADERMREVNEESTEICGYRCHNNRSGSGSLCDLCLRSL